MNLEGAQQLTKNEQKSIQGGLIDCIDPATNRCKRYNRSCAPPCRIDLIDPPIEP
ncbi:hypothetical protein [Flavobacterium sp. ALJ2]|uniref:hypothetical protein n=1 Tax=Flavobacterium sp. ALJ2 TaxID=2786960 RepID=UPI001E55BBC6|nr:hypothetical protein [Flavobacterium sp. ALJ2]